MDRRAGRNVPRFGLGPRIALATLAAALAGILATAGFLEPDPRGFGTHEQLGRPPCPILTSSGRPCPTCGLTTSFALFVRGKLGRAWRANPAGLPLASTCLCLIPWLAASAATGRPRGVRSAGEALAIVAVVAAVLTVLIWSVRRSLSLI